MKKKGLAAALVRSAAEKGLRDIRENPERGLRNLVDLASMFVGGPNQKVFFDAAREELQKPDSPYFAVISKLVANTDPDSLLEIGMTLGYYCLTEGAGEIRKVESEQGFNIPWCLSWQLDSTLAPQPAQINGILAQARELGIYCHTLFIRQAYPHLALLPELIAANKDCCFLIFLQSGLLNGDLLDELSGRAVFFALDLDSDPAALDRDLDMLRAAHFMFGAFVSYRQEQKHDLRMLSGLCLQHDLNLLFMVEDARDAGWGGVSETAREFDKLRQALDSPVVPFDLWTDMAAVDRSISSEGCLALISENLDLWLINTENGETDRRFNLGRTALADILRQALPKYQ